MKIADYGLSYEFILFAEIPHALTKDSFFEMKLGLLENSSIVEIKHNGKRICYAQKITYNSKALLLSKQMFSMKNENVIDFYISLEDFVAEAYKCK